VSPDGKWVIVDFSREAGKGRLLRVPVSGGSPETFLAPAGRARVRCPSFGSSRPCVLSEAIGKKDVFSSIDPVRGRLEELAKIETQREDSLAWDLSPDGSRIALVDFFSDVVRVLDLQTKQIRTIPTPPQLGPGSVAWSADGTQLFLSAFANDKGRLLEMDAMGHTQLLLENPNAIGTVVPSPDGKRIAYVQTAFESNVTLLEHF